MWDLPESILSALIIEISLVTMLDDGVISSYDNEQLNFAISKYESISNALDEVLSIGLLSKSILYDASIKSLADSKFCVS